MAFRWKVPISDVSCHWNFSFGRHIIGSTDNVVLVTNVKFKIPNCYVRARAKVLTGFLPRALNFKFMLIVHDYFAKGPLL